MLLLYPIAANSTTPARRAQCLVGQASQAHAAGCIQAQEQRPAIIPGDDAAHMRDPQLKGLHRARLRRDAAQHADWPALRFLVGLGATQLDPHAARRELEILDVERDQQRTAERPGEADQRQRSIA
jgi:hypothetical protein